MPVRLSGATLFWIRIGSLVGVVASVGLAEMSFGMYGTHTTMPLRDIGIQLDATKTLMLAGACFVVSLICILLSSVMDGDY